MSDFDEQLLRHFAKLGEDGAVGRVYGVILRRGAVKSDDLPKATNLEESIIDKAIGRLTTIPLIAAADLRDHEVVYHALPPRRAFESVITNARWLARKTINSATGLPDFGESERVRLDSIGSTCEALATLAEANYSFPSPIRTEMLRVAHNKDEMTAYVAETLNDANKEILAVVSPPHLLGSLVWDTVVSRMGAGVPYRRITIFDEILRHGFKITKREHEEVGVDIHYIESEMMTQKFYVIDRGIVVFFNPGVLDREFQFAGQIIANQALATKYESEFDRLRRQAIPASFLLQRVEKARANALEKASRTLDKWQVIWLESKIDLGTFDPLKLDERREQVVRKDAMQAGLVSINDGEVTPNLELDFVEIRHDWESASAAHQ